jgi:Cof subfamily protein (haloacid dehalogenase superfamily)
MEQKIRAIAFDIDGTTYQNSIKDVPASARRALRLLHERGFLLAIDTSRALQEMSSLPQDFVSSMDAVITCAGARILLSGGQQEIRCLKWQETLAGLAYLEEQGIPYRWVDNQEGCCLVRADDRIRGIFRYLYDMVPPDGQWSGNPVIALLYYSSDPDQLAALERIMPHAVHTHLGYANEITPEGMDKAAALDALGAHWGIDAGSFAAFGDGDNDVSMLKHAGIGIAMANGSRACREAADEVTGRIEKDGLLEACMRHGWI